MGGETNRGAVAVREKRRRGFDLDFELFDGGAVPKPERVVPRLAPRPD